MALDIAGGSGREVLVNIDEAPAGAGTGTLGQPDR